MRASDKGKEPKVKKKPGRTPTSCAECRRLKLRCDKNVPCEKCVSRGCAEICPTGVLASTKGNRMVLSGTEELHERISQLQGRVRELEAALRTMQAGVSEDPHPLLNNDTLRLPSVGTPSHLGSSPASADSSSSKSAVSQPSPTSNAPTNVLLKSEGEDSTLDAFGTLTIGLNGAAIYIGKTARSEFLIRAPLKQEPDALPSLSHLQPRFSEASETSSSFPDLDVKETPYLRDQVYKMLPALSEAVRLCEVYLDHGKCMYTAVTRKELLDEVLMTIYQAQSYESFQSHHALALLFSVFALASHFDPNKEPYSIESQEYYQLARTTLGFASPVRQTTLASIQTLIHMAQYLDFTDSESPSAWIYIGHAVRFAFSIGLHLNGARWTLPQDDIDRRSRVFWQLFTIDTWTSFYFGRPPSISPAFIDCEYPKELEDAGQEMGFHSWSYRFTSLVSSAMASGMGPKQPAYVTILSLDRQIRDFHVPTMWKATTDSGSTPVTLNVHLYRWLVLADKETVLLNLHRAYFAQALQDNPQAIQRHRYLPSVVAIYRASWRLIRGLQLAWSNAPRILGRIHLPWSQALSAAIVMCLLVTKIPSSHLTSSALGELEALYSLFHAASTSSKAAGTLLPSIQSLCQKAQEATDPAQHHAAGYSQPPITQIELDRLSGKTHLFSDSQGSVSPLPAATMSSSFSSSSREKGRSRSTSVTLSDIPESTSALLPIFTYPTSDSLHPVIVSDLKDFAARNRTPSIRSLSDSPSDSETTTPTGVPPMSASATPYPQSSGGSSSTRHASDPSSIALGSSYFGEHNQTPRQPQHQSQRHQQHERYEYPSTPSHSQVMNLDSPESTPTHPHTSHQHHAPPPNLHFLPSSHRPPPSYPHVSMPPQHSSFGASRSSMQHHPPPQLTQPQPPPPPQQQQQQLLGFTTEYQQYYETTEARRSSSMMGMGSMGPGSGGAGSGFVAGFEPGGSIILDGTWQGFIEQLGF